MRNLVFDLNKEPDCLKILRNNNSSYDDLKDDCRGEVLSILKNPNKAIVLIVKNNYNIILILNT